MISIMPKGQSPKLKGSICNVPIDIDVSNILPRQPNSNNILIVKLKRKLQYRGRVSFEPVRPVFVLSLLSYLKENNPLYRDVVIETENIPLNLVTEAEESQNETVDFEMESEPPYLSQFLIEFQNSKIPIVIENNTLDDKVDELETTENPLNAFSCCANETTLMSNMPENAEIDNEVLILAPGEGKQPVSVIIDQFCEELAHPHLFPKGKFGYKVERNVSLSPVKCFNQRLLNYTQKFASDSDYIFLQIQ